MAHIFKKRILDEKLKEFVIEDFNEKLEIVKKWHDDYHNGTLKTDKETSREQAFNQDFFIKILGYQEKPENPYTLEPKQTTEKGQLPDVVLGYFEKEVKRPIAVVELKGASIPLDRPQRRDGNMSPIQQAFKYKTQYQSCPFVIASNFFEFRLFQDNQLDYEIWNLDDLVNPENDYYFFKKFCFLLQEKHLITKEGKSQIETLLSDIRIDEENISKKFYKEYKELRLELLRDVYKNNDSVREDINIAIEKVQKIIDRIVFVCFCEDKGLLPEYTLERVLKVSEDSFGSLWNNLKGFFEDIDGGSDKLEIPDGYNGGLFAFDGDLNCLKISDDVLRKLTQLGRYNFEEDMSVNILGHIFEQSISDLDEVRHKALEGEFDAKNSKRKKDGIFYTPDYIVSYIVKHSLGKYLEEQEEKLKEEYKLKEDILDKTYEKRERQAYEKYRRILENVKVLDPACGSGAFLVGVFDFLLAENKRVADILGGNLFSQESFLRSILKNNIYGVDINQESVEITKLSLWLKTAQKGKKLTTLDNNIKCGNSLIDDIDIAGDKAFDWNVEFKDIIESGGFDIVLGNPPYVRQELLDEVDKGVFSKKYVNVYDSVADLYVYFYELSLSLLKQDGLLGFITPNKWMEREYGRNLRQYLKSYYIQTIINFGELKIFEDASTEPAIIVIKNLKSDVDISYNMIKTIKQAQLANYETNTYKKSDLSDDIWRFISPTILSVVTKFKNADSNLSKYTNGGVYYGIKTGFNQAFIIDEQTYKKIIQYDIKSKDLLRKMVEGDDFGKWHLNHSGRYMIATEYDMDIEHKYKGVFNHLKQYEEKLIKRQDKGENYWNLRACDYYDKLEEPKLIYYHTALTHGFYFDTDGYYISANCYFISNADRYVQCILNSSLFHFIKKYLFPAFGDAEKGGRVRLDANKMNKLPIKNITDNQKQLFIQKSEQITEVSGIFYTKKQKFLKRLIDNFEIEKLSKKLENFHELDFKDFIKELKKKKVTLSLVQQDEWEDYFSDYKKELLEIKSQIDKTDKKIDKMIYELYGLSEEEIEIIEN